MPRRNRVDPFGDLYAATARGLFTGNRGCVVDDAENVVRHHGSSLWIICKLEFRGWRWPLARPKRWTPLFFLDDAVALAAGHRPCALCRRLDYLAYRDAIGPAPQTSKPLLAKDINVRLGTERLRRGRGLTRAADRLLLTVTFNDLPDGSVILDKDGAAQLVFSDVLLRFSFDRWHTPTARPKRGMATVLTPPTSLAALQHGFTPTLHSSIASAYR
jgi:hypothetical protein